MNFFTAAGFDDVEGSRTTEEGGGERLGSPPKSLRREEGDGYGGGGSAVGIFEHYLNTWKYSSSFLCLSNF